MVIDTNFKCCNILKEENYNIILRQYGWHKCNELAVNLDVTKQYWVFHVVLSGSGILNVGNKKQRLEKNQVFLLPPAERISYYADPMDPWEYVWIGLEGDDIATLLQKTSFVTGKNYVATLNSVEKFSSIIQEMFHCDNVREIDKILLSGKALEFFYYLLENIRLNDADTYNKSKEISTIIKYIKDNYNKDLMVEGICKEMCINRTTLFKLFKKEFGVSPQEYIIDYKIENARLLLLETELRLNEIAISSGFKTYSNFARTFNEKIGFYPKEYRDIKGKTWLFEKNKNEKGSQNE